MPTESPERERGDTGPQHTPRRSITSPATHCSRLFRCSACSAASVKPLACARGFLACSTNRPQKAPSASEGIQARSAFRVDHSHLPQPTARVSSDAARAPPPASNPSLALGASWLAQRIAHRKPRARARGYGPAAHPASINSHPPPRADSTATQPMPRRVRNCKRDCGRRARCPRGRPAASTSAARARAPETPPARGCTAAANRSPRRRRPCGARA